MSILQKCDLLDLPSCGSDDTGPGALGGEEQAQVCPPQVSWLFRQKPADPLLSPCVCKLHAVTASGPALVKTLSRVVFGHMVGSGEPGGTDKAQCK